MTADPADPAADPTVTLLEHLARAMPTAKRQTLRRMIADGRVRVNGVRATRANQPLETGDQVEVSDQPGARPAAGRGPRDVARLIAPLKIVFEDDDVLVVNKPPGLLTSTVP